MSSSSNIQQGITEMIKNLQLRNELESEHVTQLTSIQENLGKINELIREKMLLDKKSIKDLEDIDKMLEERNERYEEELRLKKEIIEKELIEKKIAEENEKRQKDIANIKKAAWAGAAAGAISALGTTINTVFKVGKIAVEAFIDVMKRVGEAAFNIGKSLLMLPWNMFKSLVSAAANMQGSTELLDRIEDIRKEWGSFSNAMSADVLKASTLGINLKQGAVAQMQFYKETLAPGRSMMRVWQSLPEMMKDITKTLSSLGPTINLVMNQFNNPETFKSIVAMKKGLGLADDEFKALAEHTMANGKKIEDSMYEIGNLSLQLGDKFGISSKKISSDVGKMMKDLGNFGNLTEKQMTAAATQFNRLGVEVSKVTGMMDKFDQFEDAADASSKLSQAFGLQVDSMELMRAEDPAQRQQMLADAMNRAGLSTDGMRRQSLKLLATTMGLDAATTKTMFSSANLGKSYDDVKNAADEASKKQLSQEEVLKRLADAIEKVNRTGNQLKDGFFKTFLDGIEKGIMRTPSYINMMSNLRRGLHATLWQGIGTGESITKTLGLDDMFNAIGNHFSKENMTKFFGKGGLGGAIEKIFDKNATKQTVDEQFNYITKLFTDQKDGLMSKIYPQMQKLGDIFGRIGQLIITKIGEAIGKAFKGGAALIKGDDIGKSLGDEFQKSPWGKFVMPIWEGLKSAFLSMFDGFAEIAPVLLEKAIKTITWIFKGIQYMLSSKEQRKLLDASSATGSYLGMSSKKGPAATEQEKMFDNSMNKLSSGISAVFNDEKLWEPLKKAAWGAFERIGHYLLLAWQYVTPYVKELFAALFITKTIVGAITGAVGMVIQQRMMAMAVTEGLAAAGVTTTAVTTTTTGAAGAGIITGVANAVRAIIAPFSEGITGAVASVGLLTAGALTLAAVANDVKEEDKVVKAARTQEMQSIAIGLSESVIERDKIQNHIQNLDSLGRDLTDREKEVKTKQETLLGHINESITAQQNLLKDKAIADKVESDSVRATGQAEDAKQGWAVKIHDFVKGIKDSAIRLAKQIPEAIGNAIDSILSAWEWLVVNVTKMWETIVKGGMSIYGNYMRYKGDLEAAERVANAMEDVNYAEGARKAMLSNNAYQRLANKGKLSNLKENGDISWAEAQWVGFTEGTSGLDALTQAGQMKKGKEFQQKFLSSELLGLESNKSILQYFKKNDLGDDKDAKEFQSQLLAIKSGSKFMDPTGHLKNDEYIAAIHKLNEYVDNLKVMRDFQKGKVEGGTFGNYGSAFSGVDTTAARKQEDIPVVQKGMNGYGQTTDAKPSIDKIQQSLGIITNNNTETQVNTGKIAVGLANTNKDLMEGINSIRTSTRNVDVRVAVAVELNVRELEQALVSSKDSLIRKAVSIIENNISPNSNPPRTDEKSGTDGGYIPGKVFGQPK